MKLGEWLKNYRTEHDLSMQELADACGFSKAYVSLLEKGINPTTNKPFSPTIQTFEKIAKGTGQDIDNLLRALDNDQPVTNLPSHFNEEESQLVSNYRKLDAEDKSFVFAIINRFIAGRSVGKLQQLEV